MKVWGTLDGQNKEKIFFKECPKDKQTIIQPIDPKQPDQPKGMSGGTIALIVSAVVLAVGGGCA